MPVTASLRAERGGHHAVCERWCIGVAEQGPRASAEPERVERLVQRHSYSQLEVGVVSTVAAPGEGPRAPAVRKIGQTAHVPRESWGIGIGDAAAARGSKQRALTSWYIPTLDGR